MSDGSTPDEPFSLDDVVWSEGHLTVMCGCGFVADGPDALELEQSHECPLRGVELSVDDMFEMVNDPGGKRRVHLADMANMVEQVGFAVQPVFPSDESYPWFAYTIGLWPKFGGEFVVRGFGDDTSDVAGAFATWLMDNVFTLTPGVHQINEGVPEARVKVEVWRGPTEDFGAACAYHKTEDFPRFQVLMADDAGRFPGDPGCECAEFQVKGLP